MQSVSFDRAAQTYDQTRGFPPSIADLVADCAQQMLGPVALALEVGVGTGRIARPLSARGVPLVGIDLSAAMMQQLRANLAAGTPSPLLVQGDAASLPIATGVADAVVAVHVFHLIANWRAALDEVRRVLRPGGALLTGYEGRPADSPGARLMTRWDEIVRAAGWLEHHPPLHEFDDIKTYLLATGAELTEQAVGEWTVTRTLSRQIETIEHRTWSTTWDVPDEFFPRCLAELRAWAAREFGGLDAAYEVPHRFIWQHFAWPAPAAGRTSREGPSQC